MFFDPFQQRPNPIYLFDKRLYNYGLNNSSAIINMKILLSELFGGINAGIFDQQILQYLYYQGIKKIINYV